MIPGLCAIVLGAIALWQAVMAAVWRRVAIDARADGYRDGAAAWRAAFEAQQEHMRVLGARHNTFVAGVKRCQGPGVRGSARAMHQAIHDAAVAANRAAEEARVADPAGPP